MSKCGWSYGTLGMHPCQLGQCIGADECDKKPKCDHLDTRLRDDHRPFAEFDDFVYCPLCGEKL